MPQALHPRCSRRAAHAEGLRLQCDADEDFIIDTVPGAPQAVFASCCSGHGFKFASAIGEILADLSTEGRSAFDLAPFSLARFAA